MALPLVRLNDVDLRTLGLSSGASFEVLTITGRGHAPTRDRELQFPGDLGARDFGSKPDIRRITISGVLYANTLIQFQEALDKLKSLTRMRLRIDDMLISEAEAQTLWFADESVIHQGTAQSGTATTIVLDTAASATDDFYNGMEVEIIDGTGSGQVRRIRDYVGSTKTVTVQGQWEMTPNSTSVFWIRENRYHLVNYSGTMNEERIANNWYALGYSNITLPFKSVYPFAIGDWQSVEFTPTASGKFLKVATGNAPSYPVIDIKGTAFNPRVAEVTHALVAHFSDGNASNILNENVAAARSSGLLAQPGKLNQAMTLNPNRALTQSEVVSWTVRTVSGARGDALNLNQGTVAFWVNKRSDWNDGTKRYLFYAQADANNRLNIYQNTDNTLTFEVNNVTLTYDVSSWTAGIWYLVVLRFATTQTVLGGSNYLEVWAASAAAGSISQVAASTSNPADPTTLPSTAYLGSNNGANGFNGRIDELAIWDVTLTNGQITSLYASGTGVRPGQMASHSLIAYGDFDGTVGVALTGAALFSRDVRTLSSSATTTTAATVAADGDKVFANGDRFVLADETGYKVESTVDGSPTATSVPYASLTNADKVGVSAGFDGASRFERTTTADLDVTTEDIIISAWMKTSNKSNQQNVFQKSQGPLFPGYYIFTTNTSGVFGGYLRDASGNTLNHQGTNVGTDGRWHHFLWVVDRNSSTGSKLYIDGVQVGSSGDPTTVGSVTNAQKLTVGAGTSGGLIGNLKDVRIWIAADLFTGVNIAAKVRTLASNPLGASVSWNGNAEKGWWHLTDASFATQATDSSASGYHLDNIVGTPTRDQAGVVISKNIVADGGMENAAFGGWSDGITGTLITKNTTVFRKDARSLRVTNVDGSQAWARQTIKTASGEDYVARGWLYGPTTVDGISRVMDIGFTNLITSNPGFESGAIGPWITFGTNALAIETTTVKHGTYSAKVTYNDDLRLIAQAGPFTIGTYTTAHLAVWVYIPTAFDGASIFLWDDGSYVGATQTGGTANLSLRDQWQKVTLTITTTTDGAGTIVLRTSGTPTAGRFIYVDSASFAVVGRSINATQAGVSAGTWGHVETCFEADGASTTIDLGSGSITNAELGYWDAVQLLASQVDGGGAESGGTVNVSLPTGWSNYGTGLASAYKANTASNGGTGKVHSGSFSVYANASANDGGVSLTPTTVANQWYEISAWVWQVNGAVSNVGIWLQEASGWSADSSAARVTATGEWQRLSVIAKATSVSPPVRIRTLAGAAEFYVDDVSVVHRPVLDATLTALPGGSRFEPTRLGRGYHAGGNEQFVWAATGYSNEFAARVIVRPQFPSSINTVNGEITIFRHTGDASNFYELNFNTVSDRWRFVKVTGGNSFAAVSRVQNFSPNDEIEVGVYSDPTSGVNIWVDGSTNGSTPSTDTTSLATRPETFILGNNAAFSQPADMIIDELEVLVKAAGADYFGERYRKAREVGNTNAVLTYSGSLDSGDILSIDAQTRKVISRAKLWDASAAGESDVLTDLSLMTSRIPMMSERNALFYFPNSIPGGVEVRYRKNWN